jgi:membrane-bound lytic murein transglycosylase D
MISPMETLRSILVFILLDLSIEHPNRLNATVSIVVSTFYTSSPLLSSCDTFDRTWKSAKLSRYPGDKMFLLDNKRENNVIFYQDRNLGPDFPKGYAGFTHGKEPDLNLKLLGAILWAGFLCIQLSSCATTPRAATITKVIQIPDAIPQATTSLDRSPTSVPSTDQIQGQSDNVLAEPPQTELAPNNTGPSIVDETEESEDEADAESEITYDVPIVRNESVEAHIEYFQTVIKDRFELWLARSGRYIPVMKETFKSYGLPEDLVFVALIESGFNPAAYSRAKAVGPWQFIKGTGRKYGLRIDEWIDERRDPIKSTVAAAKYLRDLYNMFGSWPLALASYNAGEGKVMRAMARTRSDDFWDLRSSRYLRRETKNYVPKFMAATIIAKSPEKYGFKLDPWVPLQFDEVIIESPTDLRVVAQAAGITYQELKDLNPELRSTITPLNYKDYVLKLPYGTKQTFLENFANISPEKRMIQLRHRVRRGETLSVLARRYGTSVQAIRELNNLGKSRIIREGSYLLIPMSSKVAERQERQERKQLSLAAPSSTTTLEDEQGLKKIVYRVRRGDTLWKISKYFNVPISQIREWNNLSHPSRLKAGKRLVLYVKAEES